MRKFRRIKVQTPRGVDYVIVKKEDDVVDCALYAIQALDKATGDPMRILKNALATVRQS